MIEPAVLLQGIAEGATHLVLDLLERPDAEELLASGTVDVSRWCVYYDDVLALRLIRQRCAGLPGLDLDEELGNAAFFGHWRTVQFLLGLGADPCSRVADTGETALHNALCKADRPYYLEVVRLLLDAGADVHATTVPGKESGAFMRDVRTRGETPLHRAAAFADLATIGLLLAHGADRQARDANGDSPLGWASWHLRPGVILDALCFPPHRIGAGHRERIVSDHGRGWGNGMDWNLRGRPRAAGA